jgi:hypothetical protein
MTTINFRFKFIIGEKGGLRRNGGCRERRGRSWRRLRRVIRCDDTPELMRRAGNATSSISPIRKRAHECFCKLIDVFTAAGYGLYRTSTGSWSRRQRLTARRNASSIVLSSELWIPTGSSRAGERASNALGLG